MNARVRLVAVKNVVHGSIEAGRTRLRSDQERPVSGECFGRIETLLAGANKHELLAGHVGVGKVYNFGPFSRDRDAVHADVELSFGDGLDHRFPRGDLPVDDTVEAAADLVDRVIFPADGLAARRIDEVERYVVVARYCHYLRAAHVGQAVVDVRGVGIGEEKPAGIQVGQITVRLHGGQGGVEGRSPSAAGREDEAEILGCKRLAHDL